MTSAPKKQTWQERCKELHEYHIGQVKKTRGWTIRNTAKEVGRSVGCVSEDLMLFEFLRAHPEIASLRRISDALDWIRDYKVKYDDRRYHR